MLIPAAWHETLQEYRLPFMCEIIRTSYHEFTTPPNFLPPLSYYYTFDSENIENVNP